jgi:uncharacterized protein (UPF0264 family)
MSLFPSSAGLLVSVRNSTEADAALAGGADLIDVKEPKRGPLGPADANVIESVLSRVAGRVPVSAAWGELRADAQLPRLPNLRYVKWGLAGWQGRDWRAMLDRLRAASEPGRQQVVFTAYADWRRAAAPPLAEVVAFAQERPGSVLLLDTFDKSPAADRARPFTLLDWIPMRELVRLSARCREAGIRVALAGSLGPLEVAALARSGATWLAVRGAVCHGGRGGIVCTDQVRALIELLKAPERKLRATTSRDGACFKTRADSPSM